MKKIYFIVPYPHGQAPSQRFRFEQYYDILTKAGYKYRVSSFLDVKAWNILYRPGHIVSKVAGIVRGFMRRTVDLTRIYKYDFVFIHREAGPVGPPVFEWIIAKLLAKKIIYDFDDAIWLPNTSANNQIAAGLKWHSKTASICRWSYRVSCGNSYLADYARQYNSRVVVNPTTIDTIHLHNQVKNQQTDKIVIGWTGTHSTATYLDDILPVLKKMEATLDFTFVVISNSPLASDLKSLKYLPWNKDTEIDDLIQFNIGIMPLRDDQWAKGKCGFKALQYMSLGIPAIISPVGVNTQIVDDNLNGKLCSSPEQWEEALREYITNDAIRTSAGTAARKKITDRYSVISNAENFMLLFS